MSDYWTIAVSGATGLVGTALTEQLCAHGHTVRRITRRDPRPDSGDIQWRPSRGEIDRGALAGVDAVVHLAGENIADGRWSEEKKRAIAESRVKGTTLLAEALAGLNPRPKVLVSASAVGFYGERGKHPVDEESPPGEGFLATTCREWEAATRPAWESGMRVVQARIGLVLSRDGGALGKALPVFRMGLGGVLGSGEQIMSWVSLEDLVRALEFCVFNESVHGAVNVVAPHAVSNREFTKTLGAELGKPTMIPVPAFALRVALGGLADEALLCSADVQPTRLRESGFQFEYPELRPAIHHALSNGG